MKTNTLLTIIAAVVALGSPFSADASTNTALSDKPEVTCLFRHTANAPYDVRISTWLGGMAARVEIIPLTQRTIVVSYNTGDLHGAKIAGRDHSRIGFRVCKGGKPTVLFDVLTTDKADKALANLVTRLSDKAEWQMALNLQNHGQLNTALFARVPVSMNNYATCSR